MVTNLLDNYLETLVDVKEFYEALQLLFEECKQGHCFHLVSSLLLHKILAQFSTLSSQHIFGDDLFKQDRSRLLGLRRLLVDRNRYVGWLTGRRRKVDIGRKQDGVSNQFWDS